MTTQQPSGSPTQRRALARVTGAAGILTLVTVLGTSLANDYQSASFTSDAEQAVTFSGPSMTRSGSSAHFSPR